jgi:hypothetical protein
MLSATVAGARAPTRPGAGSAAVLPLTQYLMINAMTTNNNIDPYTTVVRKKDAILGCIKVKLS